MPHANRAQIDFRAAVEERYTDGELRPGVIQGRRLLQNRPTSAMRCSRT